MQDCNCNIMEGFECKTFHCNHYEQFWMEDFRATRVLQWLHLMQFCSLWIFSCDVEARGFLLVTPGFWWKRCERVETFLIETQWRRVWLGFERVKLMIWWARDVSHSHTVSKTSVMCDLCSKGWKRWTLDVVSHLHTLEAYMRIEAISRCGDVSLSDTVV